MKTEVQPLTGDKAGLVECKDGRLLAFDNWWVEQFNEEPSRENIRKRIAQLNAEAAP